MGYQAYPEYKDSEVEWFGQCPAHWQRHRLKWTVGSLKNGVWGSEPSGEDDLYCIRVADFDRIQLRTSPDNLTLRSVERKDRAGRLLNKSDLLLEKSGGGDKQLVGAVVEYTLNKAAVCSNFVAAMTTASNVHSRYLVYLHAHLYSSRVNYRSIKQSTGIQNLDAQMYFDEQVIYPKNHDEQSRISSFLDYKTAQIDRLIEKKQKLFEKLQEQRLAIITKGVTKGLDDSVPMKDSAIEWLGKIPKSWSIQRLRFLVKNIEQGWSPQCNSEVADENSWGVLKVGCVNGDTFDENENKALPANLEPKHEYEVVPGDILISRANTKDLLGSAALVEKGARSKLILCDKLYRIVPEKQLNRRFAVHFLRSRAARNQYEKDSSGASDSMQNIGQGTIKNLIVCVPPLEEQETLVDQIDKLTARIDKSLGFNQQAIETLQEYRTALITAAVTGQIDVRDWKAPVAAETSEQDKEVA